MLSLKGRIRSDIKIRKADVNSKSFENKRVVVVGGTNGLGRSIAKNMVSKGASVTVVGRTFRDAGVNNISFLEADFCSLKAAETIADKIPAEDLDYLVLTTGIFSSVTRKETHEGVEVDLAVSYLSRYVLLRKIADRLGVNRNGDAKVKVFIMGFPGMNVKANIEDFNSEKRYNAGTAHYNTIIGNEAIVHKYSMKNNGFHCFGLNPGLIKSDIRTGLTGQDSLLTRIVEWFISAFNQDSDTYADKLMSLFLSSDLDDYNGLMFNKNADLIETSKVFLKSSYIDAVIQASDDVIKKVLA